MPVFTVLSFRTPKSAENLKINSWKSAVHVLHQTTVPALDHWRRRQHTFRCFRTKTRHAAGKMKALRKGHVTFRMLSIRKRLLSHFVQNIRYLVGMSDITTISNNRGKYCSDFMQKFAEKTRVSQCTFLVILVIHGRFWWFWSDAVVFRLFKVFSSSLQHIWRTYRANIWKYNYRECWCYIICIKLCFPGINQWLFLHVLAICL